MTNPNLQQMFYLDNLSLIMITLVLLVGVAITGFSTRYLQGNSNNQRYYAYLAALIATVLVMVSSDHISIFIVAWTASNFILTRLMLHNHKWEAARQSSILALKNFAIGSIFLSSSLTILYLVTDNTSIQAILTTPIATHWLIISALLMLLAVMTQSGAWPFHLWLNSSLNSPTPVSAMMHAGIINGGGYLLARFAPMLTKQPIVLKMIFITGIITAILGTLWKLMQHNVKRLLACSTMGQMGFMIAQCGLGLFPAAVAHLCWHGLFKAYLFLASGAASQEKRLDLNYPPSTKNFIFALICGAMGAAVFAVTSGKVINTADTNLFLVLIAMIAATQFALPITTSNATLKLPVALIATIIISTTYGLSVGLITNILITAGIAKPQPLNSLHIIALLLLLGAWLIITFKHKLSSNYKPDWLLKIYVQLLNASQPHPKTVTAHRNQYQF